MRQPPEILGSVFLPATPQMAGGRFAITFTPQLSGTIVMRVVVDPAGRYLPVLGLPKPVRLITLSSMSLRGGALMTSHIPVSLAVAVDPRGPQPAAVAPSPPPWNHRLVPQALHVTEAAQDGAWSHLAAKECHG